MNMAASLIAPAWLAVATIGILVLILHVRQRRTIAIPSIQLWRHVDGGAAARQRLRLPSPSALLMLQLLFVTLTALALARPWIGTAPRLGHDIVVLDLSDGIGGADGAPSRFDAAVAAVAAAAAEVSGRVSLIAAGPRPQLVAARLVPPDRNLRDFARRPFAAGPADWTEVIRLVAGVRLAGEPTRVVILGNGTSLGAARLGKTFPGLTLEQQAVPAAPPPRARLDADLRAIDAKAGKWRAEGRVGFAPGTTLPVTVTALVQPEGSAGFLEWGRVEVKPQAQAAVPSGGPLAAPFALDLDLRSPGAVVLRLGDAGGWLGRSRQFVVRPHPRVLKVLQLGPISEPLTRALRAAAEVELFAADAMPADTAAFDLVVVNGIAVARTPDTNVLWLGAGHAASEAAAAPRVPPETGGWEVDHPLAGSVAWAGIKIGRAYGFSPLRGGNAILEAGGAPLIEARTTLTGREVRIAFDLDASNWPEQPGFPVFVANLLHWIAPDLGRTIAPACVVGASCTLDPRLFGAEAVRVDPELNAAGSRSPGPVPAAAWALPAVPRDSGVLPQGFDAQFIPDADGLYRLTRGTLTRFVAVNGSPGDDGAIPASGAAPPGASARPLQSPAAWWWLLLAAFLVLAVEGWIAGRGPERFLQPASLARGNPLAPRRRILLAARLAALTFLALALAGVPLLMPDRSRNVVVVTGLDFPEASGKPGVSARIAAAAARDRAGGGDSRIGTVAIDATSHVAADLGTSPSGGAAASSTPVPTAADLEHALAVAAAMLPADAPGRIVAAFDGNETRGNAARILPALAARGVTIDVLPVPLLSGGEVLVEEVAAPPRISAGDSFPLQAMIYAATPAAATVQILKDGVSLAERPVELSRGRTRIETTLPAATAGRARYEVTVSAPGDRFPQNNRNGIVVDVAPAAQVLIVAAQPAWAEIFAKALAVHDIKSRIVEPRRAPFYLKDWLSYSAIALMNVPAIDLTTQQQELIEKAVAEHGRGLLLLGGENSFGPGGYYETPLERVSPLSSRVPREAPRVAFVFVLDRSGSMQRDEGGVTRLDIAKQATLSAIRLLYPESLIAIVVFDSEARVLLPLRPAKDLVAVTQALRDLEPGGGTAIYPGLVEALHQLDGVEAMAKHIVVMSDGLTQPGDFPGIVKAIGDQGITVSSVAIGESADPAQLQAIARMGKGAFHATQDFKALPGILSQEALLLSGKPVEERAATPIWVKRNANFLAGVPDRLPPLGGYVLTTAKPQADLYLAVADEKQQQVPLLASWRFGNGRVVALTTQSAGAWSTQWQAMAEYPLLWSQILRHITADPGNGLSAQVMRRGDEVDVSIDAVTPEGAPRAGLKLTASVSGPGAPGAETAPVPLALAETSPGQYHGRWTLDQPGEFVVRATAEQAAAAAPLLVAYPALYAFTRADPERLEALAIVTGGRVLASADEIFAQVPTRRWVARDIWQVWALIALTLFMADLILRYGSGLLGMARRRDGTSGRG